MTYRSFVDKLSAHDSLWDKLRKGRNPFEEEPPVSAEAEFPAGMPEGEQPETPQSLYEKYGQQLQDTIQGLQSEEYLSPEYFARKKQGGLATTAMTEEQIGTASQGAIEEIARQIEQKNKRWQEQAPERAKLIPGGTEFASFLETPAPEWLPKFSPMGSPIQTVGDIPKLLTEMPVLAEIGGIGKLGGKVGAVGKGIPKEIPISQQIAKLWNSSELSIFEKRQLAKDAGLSASTRVSKNRAWWTLSEQERNSLEPLLQGKLTPEIPPVGKIVPEGKLPVPEVGMPEVGLKGAVPPDNITDERGLITWYNKQFVDNTSSIRREADKMMQESKGTYEQRLKLSNDWEQKQLQPIKDAYMAEYYKEAERRGIKPDRVPSEAAKVTEKVIPEVTKLDMTDPYVKTRLDAVQEAIKGDVSSPSEAKAIIKNRGLYANDVNRAIHDAYFIEDPTGVGGISKTTVLNNLQDSLLKEQHYFEPKPEVPVTGKVTPVIPEVAPGVKKPTLNEYVTQQDPTWREADRPSEIKDRYRKEYEQLYGAEAPIKPVVSPEIPKEGKIIPKTAVKPTATVEKITAEAPIKPVGGESPIVPPEKPTATGTMPPVSPNSPLSRIQGMLQTKPEKTTSWADTSLKLQEHINDSYYGLRRMQGQITKIIPIQPGGETDIITAITRAPGAANAGLTRYELAVADMKKLAPDANITDISTILFSEHGKEVLAAKGAKRVLAGGVNTVTELDQALTDLRLKLGDTKYQQAESAARMVKSVYADERVRLVNSGLISQELGDALAKEYPWYNPMRYLDYVEAEAYKGRTVKPITVTSSGLRRLSEVGSEKAIQDPLTSLPGELVKNEVRIQKNDLAKGIIKVASEDPTLGIVKRKITVPVAQVEGKPIFRPQHGEIPGTISYFENGVRQVYDVPEWLYRETSVLNQSINNPLSLIIGALNGVSRAAFTSFSPVFTVANMMNDMLPAFIRGGVTPPETIRRMILSFRSLEKDPLMQAYRLSGGLQTRFYGKDAAEIAKQVGASGGTVIGKNTNIKKAIFDAIPAFGEHGEQASRVAVFEKNLNKTLPGWKTMAPEQIAVTPQARKAAADAVEATINFGRGGYLIRSANPFVIFLNASMEGTKLPFRTLRDSVRSRWALAGVGAGVAGLSAYNMSFPEYFDVPNRVRWGSVMIMLPSTKRDLNGKSVPKYLTVIPNTREWASFFAPLTYGMEKVFKENPEDIAQFAQAMIPQVSPVGNLPIPQVMTETIQQMANYDFYTGNPIVSQGKSYLPPTEQTGAYVSPTIEKGAQATGLSPLRVQHAMQSLFGGAGSAVTSVVDMVMGIKNKRGLELKTQFDALPTANRPEWINKLSSSDKSALTATYSQPQLNIPVISSIGARFYHERGGQLEQNDWDKFNKTVEDTNKEFAKIDKVSNLGIKLGSVGGSIDLKPGVVGGSIDLSPAQRTEYQRIVSKTVTEGVRKYVATLNYSLSPEEQKYRIQQVMSHLRDQARFEFIKSQGLKASSSTTPTLPSLGGMNRSTMPSPLQQYRERKSTMPSPLRGFTR